MATLIGIMAELFLENAKHLAEMVPSETMKLSVLIQILHVCPDQQLLNTIVTLTEVTIEDLWQKVQLFYDLAALLARKMPDAVRQLFALLRGFTRKLRISEVVFGLDQIVQRLKLQKDRHLQGCLMM